jgi:hypothetical protein
VLEYGGVVHGHDMFLRESEGPRKGGRGPVLGGGEREGGDVR